PASGAVPPARARVPPGRIRLDAPARARSRTAHPVTGSAREAPRLRQRRSPCTVIDRVSEPFPGLRRRTARSKLRNPMEEGHKMGKRTATKVLAAGVTMAALAAGLVACSGGEDAEGKVYYLNFKPEQAEQWDALAKTYTEETGVEVDVETAASGTYETTLKSEMAKSDAPTLFQVNGPVGLASWADYAADLSDTEIYAHLNDQSVALTGEDDSVLGIPYVMETYGIITNTKIVND